MGPSFTVYTSEEITNRTETHSFLLRADEDKLILIDIQKHDFMHYIKKKVRYGQQTLLSCHLAL